MTDKLDTFMIVFIPVVWVLGTHQIHTQLGDRPVVQFLFYTMFVVLGIAYIAVWKMTR